MKIGLIRHFEVELQHPKGLLTQMEVAHWFKDYENASLKIRSVNLKNINWDICLSSDSPRAINTANCIYNKEMRILKELDSVDARC